jgi:hypothetical protein
LFVKAQQVHQADIVSNESLGAVLQFAKEAQKEMGYERGKKGPSRRGQKPARRVNPAV